ncbi:hypothetical protein [Paenirhodobacter sp. CAU 1674]|uniref:hypothetical protein n=1 Tax=Paenirhodobacter sp. CAU 1674 TaxID=3032596 RepID=UPI0023DAECBE|nr:hypothetical protein [Paenirhodobacter sp. CAU 1674]MDF2141215.1 hypothetical protein [Paenirhodobacter sp. CAU 1674]
MSRIAGKQQLGPRVVTITVEGRSRWRVVGLDAPSPDFPNKPEAERHLHRELASIPAARRLQERSCLRCGVTFKSQGFHHRMCERCRSHAEI